ncbi:MAG: hypothetical protein IJY00_06005 [Bacteroidaceae bacterium]|nr:hypothetical protein [Bacteroidaceae bacterium]
MPKPTDSQLKCSILLKSSFYPILFRQNKGETTWHLENPSTEEISPESWPGQTKKGRHMPSSALPHYKDNTFSARKQSVLKSTARRNPHLRRAGGGMQLCGAEPGFFLACPLSGRVEKCNFAAEDRMRKDLAACNLKKKC